MKWLLLWGVLGLAACAPSPAMQAANSGDRATLAASVRAKLQKGTLGASEVASLAQRVAAREVRGATGAEGIERIRDARACAYELDGAFADRGRGRDAPGAEASLARVEDGRLSMDEARAHAADADAGWRAVGARALVRERDREARMRALLDPEPAVRRSAVRACREARDPADLTPLAEAARLDPTPIVRTEAVRAMANLPATPGGRVADLLRDLWISGDDGLREDIALAWSSPGIWSAGGREALRIVVAAEHGPGAVEAAAAVLRQKDAPKEMTDSASARLASSIERGATSTRLEALALAAIERPELLASVRKAGGSDDPRVRVAALARLAEAREPGSVPALEALAAPGSSVSDQARWALANLRDRRVQAWVEQDLTSTQPEKRLGAASALAAMGVAGRAAPLLADEQPRVRVRAACTILVAARRGP